MSHNKLARPFLASFTMLSLFLSASTNYANAADEYDIVIYGGTSAGLIAGFQAKEMGKSVVVIEPSHHLGGLTTGGLGQTDIGNKRVIGGKSREFYQRVAEYYAKPAAWKWQKREEYRDGGQTRTAAGEETMWTFEPSAASKIFSDWIGEVDLEVMANSPMKRTAVRGQGGDGVTLTDGRISAINLESGQSIRGKVFIDATYEGDLLAEAGVSYVVGRESNDEFGESVNGVQAADWKNAIMGNRSKNAANHNFVSGVDPYVVKGDPASGLLPFIDPAGPGVEGQGDHRVQAYCFRACYTTHPENRIPFQKPEGYDEQWYELLFRNFEAGEKRTPWINSSMPNRKTDTNNNHGFSSDFIGQNYDYPEASYAERREIEARHRLYQQGLMWSLANHPRVPEWIRKDVSRWGMCKDEYTAEGEPGGGWQFQIYVREGRRMRGEMVMTQKHCESIEVVPQSIGHAAYGMDSHHTQRYVTADGFVKNEGNVQAGVRAPYRIDYHAICPKRAECKNLLVPVSLSSTHIAFGSIRMEPVFMILGQSAATAAVMAIDDRVDVQDVEYGKLKAQLLKDKQILEIEYRPPVKLVRLDPTTLPGIVVDNRDAKTDGGWSDSTSSSKFVGSDYLHDEDSRDGMSKARFEIKLPKSGRYEVRFGYTPNGNRATNVPVTVHSKAGEKVVRVNERNKPPIDGLFVSLGEFEFDASEPAVIEVSNTKTDGYTVIDAVQLVEVE